MKDDSRGEQILPTEIFEGNDLSAERFSLQEAIAKVGGFGKLLFDKREIQVGSS